MEQLQVVTQDTNSASGIVKFTPAVGQKKVVLESVTSTFSTTTTVDDR